MFERHIDSCTQFGPVALGNGLKYKGVVVKAAGRRRGNNNTVLYVDISPADEIIANELLDILEKKGNFTCNLITKKIID